MVAFERLRRMVDNALQTSGIRLILLNIWCNRMDLIVITR